MIPDRLSDMDSIPNTLSLSQLSPQEQQEIAVAVLCDSKLEALKAMTKCAEAIGRTAKAILEFQSALEVCELEQIYGD